jgi:peptidyl-dipeptidase Dcp
MANPFFEPLPENGVPEFDQILSHHYEEAFERGFEEQNREIQAIIGNREAPTFGNTIEAMERSGELLERVGNVFWNLTSSDTSDELQALELALSPRLAAHNSQIYSDPALFKRVQAITESDQALDPEASQLLEEIHGSFVRAGAHLSESARERVNEITESCRTLMNLSWWWTQQKIFPVCLTLC